MYFVLLYLRVSMVQRVLLVDTYIYLFSTCSGSGSGSDSTWYGSVYRAATNTSTIIGIVVGCVAGAIVLIGIIVVTIILCKRKKRTQIWATQVQQQQQQIGMQPAFITGTQQPWAPPGPYYYPPPGYPAYNPSQPILMHT